MAQLAAEHGGDAGKANEATTAATTTTDDADKDKSDEGDKSKEKPAGETVVHASGLKADGGDFDAANPGAGQEADREWPLPDKKICACEMSFPIPANLGA